MLAKKIFIISSILLLIMVVFFGIYMVAFKPKDIAMVEDLIEMAETKDIMDVLSEKIDNITSDSIISYTVGPNGDTIRYIDAVDGRIWTMTLRGTNREALTQETSGVPKSARWSRSGESVIHKSEDGAIHVINLTTNKKTELRAGMDDVIWAQAGGKILYKYYDEKTKERSLNIADEDGSNWKKIADLPFRNTIFEQIPSSIFVLYWPRSEAKIATELYSVNTISGSDNRKIFGGPRGAEFLSSPGGDKILVSSLRDDGSLTLGLLDGSGENYVDLQVPTMISKTVWSRDGKYIYYAQPIDLPTTTILPDDYEKNTVKTHDTFYRMEIRSGKKERIIELDEIVAKYDANNLQLSPAEDVLFFINRVDGLLYRINM
jgi:hypothetical protein